MSEQAKPTSAVAPVPTDVTAPAAPQQQPQDQERFAQLARKEKALRMQAQQIKEEKAKLESEKGKYIEPSGLKQKFLSNPQSLGLTYEDIAQAYLNQPTPENQKMMALQQEIENLKNGQQQVLSQAEQAQKKAYDTAVKQLTREVGMLVDGGDEAYETIKATGNQSAVVELIETTYKEDGILMTAEEAAKQIEDYLLEEAVKLSSLKKVQSRLKPAIEEASTTQTQQKPQITSQPQPTKTLTNAIVQQSSPLSNKEKRQRAILAFQGKLS